MNKLLLLALLVSRLPVASAQVPKYDAKNLPRFEDFPIKEIFERPPAASVLRRPEQLRFRTRIREGVSKGRGVWTGSRKDAEEWPGQNCHHFVIRWGCGSNYLMMAVVDAETGNVFPPPLASVGTDLCVSRDMMREGRV
jgi:hypothetical protein